MKYRIKRTSNNELMHYGVPGMKWGVRKLNRINTRAEGHSAIANTLRYRIENRKGSKNPISKFLNTADKMEIVRQDELCRRGREKVETILAELEREGVTLKTIKTYKTSYLVGGRANFLVSYNGARYDVSE